ncbi:N5-methyltetrahydromethanopterin:coenzyme M methyltransferase subunit F [Methanosarcina sp. WWM596]|nr:N5-methyltetrahydromethanopterin:coenzyme M methyltransferase subunit F [Methanosarcina sp. WWM596]AKB20462.1 N5-methyltetrahydromethanopterin:coenzyme M methyltransferase subunit F [Methanosarcina sp. WH1]
MAEEYGKGVPMVLNPQMGAIDATVESIRYRAQLISRNQKLDSGIMSTGMIGFAAGFLFSLLMVIILPLMAGL